MDTSVFQPMQAFTFRRGVYASESVAALPVSLLPKAVIESPVLLSGDMSSGVLPWKAACSVGSAIFIGPVEWSIRLTDARGM